jgi:hypothetical protein
MVPKVIVPRAAVPKAIVSKAIIPRAIVPRAIVPRAIIPKVMVPRVIVFKAIVLKAIVPISSKKLKGINQLTVVIYLIPPSFRRRSRLNSLFKSYMFIRLPILPISSFLSSSSCH